MKMNKRVRVGLIGNVLDAAELGESVLEALYLESQDETAVLGHRSDRVIEPRTQASAPRPEVDELDGRIALAWLGSDGRHPALIPLTFRRRGTARQYNNAARCTPGDDRTSQPAADLGLGQRPNTTARNWLPVLEPSRVPRDTAPIRKLLSL
jgi:hypothetical protein